MRILESPLIASLVVTNCLGLAIVAAAAFLPLPDTSDSRSAPTGPSAKESTLRDQGLDLSKALDRPIFHVTRRKPQQRVAAPKQEPVQEKVEAPYSLVGVLGSSEAQRTAYLQHNETQETLVVQLGSTIGSWRVDTIGTNFVTLVMGEDRQVIQLAGGE